MSEKDTGNQLENASGINIEDPSSGSTLTESDDFFGSLDKVHGEGKFTVEAPAIPEPTKATQPASDKKDEADPTVLQKELKETKARYAESSEEGKRLAGEVGELKGKLEAFIQMQTQPKEERQPKDVVEALGLPQDFVPDLEELKDPQSDTFKYFSAIMQMGNMNHQSQVEQSVSQRLKEDNFRKTNGYEKESDWNDFKKWAEGKTLGLEDIHLLFTRKDRENKIAEEAKNSHLQQMKKTGTNISSLFNVGTSGKAPDPTADLAVVLGGKKTSYFD